MEAKMEAKMTYRVYGHVHYFSYPCNNHRYLDRKKKESYINLYVSQNGAIEKDFKYKLYFFYVVGFLQNDNYGVWGG